MAERVPDVVCFGEILWDILPGGTVPGGAPMNVAYHIHQLGGYPALITRIGNDERGAGLRSVLDGKNINMGLLQTDERYPTGIVYGTADQKGDMRYEIVAPAAWDLIEATAAATAQVKAADYFVCGSLAARKEVSRKTLFTLLEQAKTKVIDINLRPPFYTPALISDLIAAADIIKLNSDELALISSWWNFTGNLPEQVLALQQRSNAKTIIVTRGGDGAVVWHSDRLYDHPGFRVKVADTVGSGDAFLAGFLHRCMQGKAMDEALSFACALGAFVASKNGAWPDYRPAEIIALFTSELTPVNIK